MSEDNYSDINVTTPNYDAEPNDDDIEVVEENDDDDAEEVGEDTSDDSKETDDDNEEEDEEEDKEDDNKKPPVKKNRVQERIDNLTRDKYEAQRRADALQKELETIRSRQNSDNIDQPDPNDYPAGKWDAQYLEDLSDYKVQKALENVKVSEIKTQREAVVNSLEKILEETVEDYSEVREIFFEHNLTTNPEFARIVAESENPAAMIYFLGKNTQEIDKMASMTAAQATRYIGRLEALIDNDTKEVGSNTKKSEPNVRRVSSAPKPVAPTKPKLSGVSYSDISKMSQAEYERYRNKKDN